MANVYLADMKLLQRDNESADTALSAYEKDMFSGSSAKAQEHHDHIANDVAQDTLRYLFAIFN